MRKLFLIAVVVLALFSATATAKGGSIHGDVVGDGGVNNYCGSYEASYGKAAWFYGPRGYGNYECDHFTGWTNDYFVYQSCGGCYMNSWWHLPSSWSADWRPVDVYAWRLL